MKSKTIYSIHWKMTPCPELPHGGSDELGEEFDSYEQATNRIVAIQTEPNRFGYEDWLANACMWVADQNGNILS